MATKPKMQYLVLQANTYVYGIAKFRYRCRIFADMSDASILQSLQLQNAKHKNDKVNVAMKSHSDNCIVGDEYYDFPTTTKLHEIFRRIDDAGFSVQTSHASLGAGGSEMQSWTFTKCI